MEKRLSIFIAFYLIFGVYSLHAQDITALETKAKEHYNSYQFNKAIALYNQILNNSTDSLLRAKVESMMILCENGEAMLQFAFNPKVISTKETNYSNFFLSYPGFNNKSWIPTPQSLLNDSTVANAVTYFPEGSKELIYSAPNSSGTWDLYTISKINDTLWSAPALVGDNITSSGNEIFPILSQDGKTLYFSSNGHYGMGGYDLYYSVKDEESNSWGIPQNMGFPYSSTADDYLYYNAPSGDITFFASNRETNSKEKLLIYSLVYEPNPIKKEISGIEASKIAKLSENLINKDKEQKEGTSAKEESESGQYTLIVKEVRALQQEINKTATQQSEARNLYNTLNNPDDKKALEVKLAELEQKSLTLQKNLNETSTKLQKIEMDFLAKGIIITEPEIEADEQESDSKLPTVKYANNTLGAPISITTLIPEPEIDLKFKISDNATIYEIEEFPNGLVYQIQLFLVNKKAASSALKGLSPVFARKTATGKYIYSTGAFRKYQDAVDQIYKVRKRGFPTAIITAYKDGKSISLTTAKKLEVEQKNSGVFNVVIKGLDVLPAEALNAIKATTDKDIAKTVENGATNYMIGPFTIEDDAQTVAKALSITNITASVEKVEQK